ncbi:uncharacterized protein V6R79_003802 [Siganus canaliculatus]
MIRANRVRLQTDTLFKNSYRKTATNQPTVSTQPQSGYAFLRCAGSSLSHRGSSCNQQEPRDTSGYVPLPESPEVPCPGQDESEFFVCRRYQVPGSRIAKHHSVHLMLRGRRAESK